MSYCIPMSYCMNASRLLNLAAIFSLDFESQCNTHKPFLQHNLNSSMTKSFSEKTHAFEVRFPVIGSFETEPGSGFNRNRCRSGFYRIQTRFLPNPDPIPAGSGSGSSKDLFFPLDERKHTSLSRCYTRTKTDVSQYILSR